MTLTEWVLVGGWLLAPFVLILLARHWRDENAATVHDPKAVLPGHFVLGAMSSNGY